jgi:hypothetical protein
MIGQALKPFSGNPPYAILRVGTTETLASYATWSAPIALPDRGCFTVQSGMVEAPRL